MGLLAAGLGILGAACVGTGRGDTGRENTGREDSGRENTGREDTGRENTGREDTETRGDLGLEATGSARPYATPLPRARSAAVDAAPTPDGSLAGYVALALEREPGLRARSERVEAARERGAQDRALPDPVLTYTEFVEPLETRTGPNARRLRLDQPFPWPGTRSARGALADAEAERQAAELHVAATALVEQVERAWLDLGFARERARLAAENRELLESLAPVVERRVETGGPREDWLRLEIAVARLTEEQRAAEAALGPLSVQLASLCGIEPSDEPLPARLGPLAANGAQSLDAQSLDGQSLDGRSLQAEAALGRARAANPEVLAALADLERAEAAIDLARRADRPDLALGVEYVEIGDALDPNSPDSGQDPLAVRLSIGLPLWRSAYAATEREAERRQRAARLDLDARLAGLDAELAQVVFEVEDAGRKLVLFRDTLLPRAREAYELTISSYTVGEASLPELIAAERTLLDLELEAWGALRDRGRARAHLRALTGELPTSDPVR